MHLMTLQLINLLFTKASSEMVPVVGKEERKEGRGGKWEESAEVSYNYLSCGLKISANGSYGMIN